MGTHLTFLKPQHCRGSNGVKMEHYKHRTRSGRAESCPDPCALQGALKVSKNNFFGRNTKNPPSNSDSIGDGPVTSAGRSRDISAGAEISKNNFFGEIERQSRFN